MKSEKENYYIKEILKILVQGDIVATGKIASMIALSEKATRNKLEHLQSYLQENQLGSIEKKPRVGIWLNMDEQQKEKMLRLLDGAEHFSVGYDATQRVRETLQIFFRMMPRETITTQKLAEELYLSPPTVLKVIKDCEKWLAPYGIQINNERSRGCSLKYDETSYRIALKDYIMLDHDLDETLSLIHILCKHGIREYAISETQKFGHVTYFWNGNRSEKLDEKLEDYVEIKSDVIPFEQRPWMKSAEITDVLCAAIESGNYDFLRTNYPNGDMVGHTGNFEATVIGVESVDLQLARVKKAVDAVNGILIVTADHGNADEMYEKKKKEDAPVKAKTSHTLNKVPFIIYGADVELKQDEQLGLSNVAATVADLLEVAPNEHWNESIIKK